jgi:hypothetical protein
VDLGAFFFAFPLSAVHNLMSMLALCRENGATRGMEMGWGEIRAARKADNGEEDQTEF